MYTFELFPYSNTVGCRDRDRMVVIFTTTCSISAYRQFATDDVSSNLDQGEVYNIMW